MPQTQGLERPDAQTDSDGEIRDETFSAAGSDDDLLDELDKDLEEKVKRARPLQSHWRISSTNRSDKNCQRTS